MQKYTDVVTSSRSGAAIPDASVTVKTHPGAVVATIYSDDGSTAKANPLTTDENGEFSFYAADGDYTLTVSGTGITERTIGPITLLDGDDADADTLLATDVTFTPSGSGAVANTVQGKERQIVSLLDFIPLASQAAVIDGTTTTDVTTYVQAALDSGAKAVYGPYGTYPVNDLNPPSNIEVYGTGDGTLFKLNANADVFKIDGTSNVTLRDFKIDGVRATYTTTSNEGIAVNWVSTAGSNVKIKNVTIRDCAGAGIQCLASSGQASSDLRVEDCDVQDVGSHGIIAQDYISNVWFCRNRVKNWGLGVSDRVGIVGTRDGSFFVCSDNIVIASASAMGTSAHGISVDRTTGATVKGNIVSATKGYGIEFGAVTNGSIAGNTVSGATRASIALSGNEASTLKNTNVAVVGNNVSGGSAQGIYAFMTSGAGTYFHENITVSGNTVNSHTNTTSGLGIQLEFCDKLSVVGNTVYNSGLAGIYFVDSINFFIDGNTVINNNCGTIQTVSSITLSGSTATATVTGHGYSTNDVVTIFGANPPRYNGSVTITVTGDDTFTYTTASGLASPAVGTIKVVEPNSQSYGGVRVAYSTVTTKNLWSLGTNHIYGNGFREIYDVSVNGFTGLANDVVVLKEARFAPRAENLTSGESSNILDRLGLFTTNNKIVFAYNNAGTVTYITLDLDGSDTTWAHGTTAP